MRFILAALAAAYLASCGAEPSRNVLTPNGLGPVKAGMTVQQAEEALRAKLTTLKAEEPEACRYAFRADGTAPAVGYMIIGRHIQRIDIFANRAQPTPVLSDKGFGIGSPEQAVAAAYGAALQNMPHPYLPETGRILRVGAGDAALVFETENGKVTSFRAGRVPFVDYKEHCA